MPDKLMLDKTLCAEYLYEDAAFWRAADAVPNTAETLRWQNALHYAIIRRDVAAAEEICKAMQSYARVFCPRCEGMILASALGRCLTAALHHYRGVPDDFVHDTFHDFSRWAENYEKLHSAQGIDELPWILYPFCGKIYKLGRLQYETTQFPYPYYVYRNNQSGTFAIFAAPGVDITQDGHVALTNGRPQPAVLTTTLQVQNGKLTGYAADGAYDVLQTEKSSIALAQYTLLLAPGMQVLNLHIPAEGPLLPEAVDASFAQAKTFFAARGYTDAPIMCESWLLDAKMEQYAQKDSNTLKFMRRFVKMPVFCEQSCVGKFVFALDYTPDKLAAVVPQSGLQKSLHQYLTAGGETFDPCGVLML